MDKFQESLDFVVKCKYALFKINIKRNAEYNYLKPKQIDCVKKSIKNDALVILPTGYGKSLICELVQLLTNSTIVIISPINAIIDEQLGRFGNYAIRVNEDFSGKSGK